MVELDLWIFSAQVGSKMQTAVGFFFKVIYKCLDFLNIVRMSYY